MTNTFYTEYDQAKYGGLPHRENEERTPFQVERDRIIYSSAFRSLQSKTQVFHSGEYDFYRTRLTHSLEVAQIGRGICNHLLRKSGFLRDDFFIDPDLVEACCLAHDIGHPPFGHAGEDALNEVLKSSGGFEGNAQTLRILTTLIFGSSGMSPTRALLDGVLKYKTVFVDHDQTRCKFLYSDQQEVLDFVFDQPRWNAGRDKALEKCRSIECQIMDWADDIAYGLMDIVDGVNAHFINLNSLEQWRKGQEFTSVQEACFNDLKADILAEKIERNFAVRIGECINGTSLAAGRNLPASKSNRYAFDLIVDPIQREKVDFYKKISVELVFKTTQLKQLEYKGCVILKKLFHALKENYLKAKCPMRLLPQKLETRLVNQPEMTVDRELADFLSSLTDTTAIRIYRRLFDPTYGSITDL